MTDYKESLYCFLQSVEVFTGDFSEKGPLRYLNTKSLFLSSRTDSERKSPFVNERGPYYWEKRKVYQGVQSFECVSR